MQNNPSDSPSSPPVRIETRDPLNERDLTPRFQRLVYKLTPVFALGGNAIIFIVVFALIRSWLHTKFSVNWLDLMGMAAFGGGYIIPLVIRNRIRDRYPPQYRIVAQDSRFRVFFQGAYDQPWQEHDGQTWLTMNLELPDQVHHIHPTVHTDLTSIAQGGGAWIIARDWSQAERITFTYETFEHSYRRTHTVSYDVLVDPSDAGIRAFERWCGAMRGVISRARSVYDRSVRADEILKDLITADLSFSPVMDLESRGTPFRVHQPLFQTTFIEEKPPVVEFVRVTNEDGRDEVAAPAAEEPPQAARARR